MLARNYAKTSIYFKKARAITLPFIIHHLPFTIKNRTNGTVIKISFLKRELYFGK
jgi:hypothetical protein